MDIETLQGPILVTIAYFILWYYLLFFLQIKTKYRLQAKYKTEGKEFDRYFGQDKEMLAADRAVINTQEQMVPFLMGMWLCAIFVSPKMATWCGGLYVALRSAYPILIREKVKTMGSKKIALVTIPCYLLIFSMLVSVAWTAIN